MRSWSAQHILINTPPLLLTALITKLDQQQSSLHCHELPTNSAWDTTQLSLSDSPNYRTPHIEGQEQVQSHISHKSAHHRTYQISPDTTPPGVLTPNSRTYTMQEASGKCPPKNTKQLPSKGAEYSPHALVPHKSMCNKFAYKSHRHSRNPRKDFSHPFIPFSHNFIIAYHSARLAIDNLNLVCVRTRHILPAVSAAPAAT